ncbi:intraflagellar transport protein 172 [Trypanosoma theileri]|uniref:Intraflagellar transport protein 172 n=1 Tax=Trypanosoma theileri TaxID=67003 RepID=A0A1X0NXS2_9TRYP|nr:intraflagellar transport protein 172 [Trypanosoma theileri]ORC89482.1 intraflagellar transport protein 172 [Trypanosoma theileri]
MQVKHYKTLMASQQGFARTQAICWSPNNKRVAVADSSRMVNLYDEFGERRDKFPTKAADGKNGRSYVISGMVFSPDSSKIAVGQSDGMVAIYRIGIEWGEKKAICSKFPQTTAVTCVCWPNTSQGVELVVFGTLEGKVKVGILKANKSQSLYAHEHPVVSIASSTDGQKIISGHLDGSVYQYTFESEETNEVSGSKKIFNHSCTPYVLLWGEHICAAGQNGHITFYERNGQKSQDFDYKLEEEGDFTVGCFNPSGQSLAIASTEKFRLLDFNLRSRKWEEGVIVKLPNSCSFSAMAWKYDGSRIVTGTLTGAVDMFDTCLKRYRLRGAFEFTYVSHNQVIVKRLATGTRIVLRSNLGYEVQRVNVYQDRYLVAYTSTTLLVGDLVSCKLSEVPWQLSGREKFVFDNPQVCMVFAAGELCLIEYGKNELLGTCRTEERNAHRISVRIHESPGSGDNNEKRERKFIAYLIDRQTIQIDDLGSGISVARISHQSRIDWLELNYRANKLLFRDKQHQLFLYDLEEQSRTTLLNYCTYVQWVPGSDVVVAQNRVELCVWYSIDAPDRVAVVPIKGEVEGIERGNGKTEVIVDEGVNTVAYGLDEALIEFGTTMEDHDYNRACDLLDQIALTPETEAMWANLANLALQEMKLHIAQRCYAALGDVAKVNALNHINELAEAAAKASEGLTDGYDHYTVRAELCMLNKEYKRAEQLFLENGKIEEDMAMWEEMNRFDESISVAEARGWPDLANKRAHYYNWLMETGQYEKAGEQKEHDGKYIDAINLYLRGGTPARAANVVSVHNLKPESQLLEAIAAALFKAQVFEKAGDFFEKLKMDERAIQAYKKGHIYSRAVEFAKRAHPEQVTELEEAWGDYLVSQKHVDQAINHYIEAKKYSKAVKAAIDSRQWSKATNILESQVVGADNDQTVKGFYKNIAHHYEELHQYSDAEKFYIKAGSINDAVEMYNRAGMSDHMYRVAQRHLSQQQLIAMFVDQAKQLEAKGDYAGAERIYLKVDEPDQAIVMYKKTRDYTNMIRLVQAYRPDYLLKTHLSLAAQFEKESNFKMAETHYVAGKDWGRAVNMYRDREMWEDAVRVAKVHGGANAAKQVVLSRAMVIEAEDGVRLLMKFSLVDAGIDAALEAQKFELALQWAQLAQPAKLPYVYLKYAMHYEDQGDFRMAEDAFLKSGKPREAIDMYLHQHEFENAMRVAENYDQTAIPTILQANGRACFQQGNYREAETLFVRANAPEALLRMYMDGRLYTEAQRVAKEHCPEMLGEIAKRIALQSNDPKKAGAVLEEHGEYQMAVETYLGATPEQVSDPNVLASLWVRAVKVAQKHDRNMLKGVLRIATGKLKDAHRYVEAGKCLEDCEDYKGAINMYVHGKKFDLAEYLAKRISPELEDYVKRAIVQDSIESGGMKDAKVVEEIDPEAALKAYITNNDWDNAIRMAKQRTAEEMKYVAGLRMKYHVNKGEMAQALDVVEELPLDTGDFRFYEVWVEMAERLVKVLPLQSESNLKLDKFHTSFINVAESMATSGQKPEDVTKARALAHVVHIYYMAPRMLELSLNDYALKLMLGLPRWIPYIAPEQAFYDAGMAAKKAESDNLAFLYLNRFLDICEKIEDGALDSTAIDNEDFDCTDFPKKYPLPRTSSIGKEAEEEVNKWVLAVSIESNLDAHLPTIMDPQNQVEMFEGALQSPAGAVFPECAVTGYPIVGGGLTKCRSCQRPANQEDWNRYIVLGKNCPWCGAAESPDFKL